MLKTASGVAIIAHLPPDGIQFHNYYRHNHNATKKNDDISLDGIIEGRYIPVDGSKSMEFIATLEYPPADYSPIDCGLTVDRNQKKQQCCSGGGGGGFNITGFPLFYRMRFYSEGQFVFESLVEQVCPSSRDITIPQQDCKDYSDEMLDKLSNITCNSGGGDAINLRSYHLDGGNLLLFETVKLYAAQAASEMLEKYFPTSHLTAISCKTPGESEVNVLLGNMFIQIPSEQK